MELKIYFSHSLFFVVRKYFVKILYFFFYLNMILGVSKFSKYFLVVIHLS